MPDDRGPETTFKATVYRKLPKGQTGITSLTTQRIRMSSLLELLYNILPADAWDLEADGDVTTIIIDWSKVPPGVRDPKLPARRL